MEARLIIRWYLLAIAVVWLLPLLVMGASSSCVPEEKSVIDAEARCFEDGGMDIGFMGDEGFKVACLRDARVKSVCGPDGRVTRLNAYREWFARLKQAENACSARGGRFLYEDPNFTEPTDESFCMQAQPEVGSTMFESATCNFRAVCPSITVVCEFKCRSQRMVVGDPAPLQQQEDSGLLKRLAARR